MCAKRFKKNYEDVSSTKFVESSIYSNQTNNWKLYLSSVDRKVLHNITLLGRTLTHYTTVTLHSCIGNIEKYVKYIDAKNKSVDSRSYIAEASIISTHIS